MLPLLPKSLSLRFSADHVVELRLGDAGHPQLHGLFVLGRAGVRCVGDEIVHALPQRLGQRRAAGGQALLQLIAADEGLELARDHKGLALQCFQLFGIEDKVGHIRLSLVLLLTHLLLVLFGDGAVAVVQHGGDQLRVAGILHRRRHRVQVLGGDELLPQHQVEQSGMLNGQFDQLRGVGLDVLAVFFSVFVGAAAAILGETHRSAGPVFRADVRDVINVDNDGMLCLG